MSGRSRSLLTINMADMLAFVILLACFIGVCDGALCSRVYRHNYYSTSTTYMYCSYGCCGSSYNRYCCTASGTIAGIVIAVLSGICIVAFLFCLCIKKQKRPGRVIMPHSNVHHSNLTVVYAGTSGPGTAAYRGGPPVPPPYKAHDPPPPYAYNTGSGLNGRRQINTSTLPPGSHHTNSYMSPPEWQAPPPGGPPRYDNPPMPQPQTPPRPISTPAPPYSELPGSPENSDNTIHPPPGPLPPATAPVSHT